MSSFNSNKTSVERSKNIVKNKLKIYNTECNSSKEKSNEKQKALDKNITNPSNQLLNSKSKNNIKNVKIDIHKKEINLVSSSIVNDKIINRKKVWKMIKTALQRQQRMRFWDQIKILISTLMLRLLNL